MLNSYRLRSTIVAILLPIMAVLVAIVIFGGFVAIAGAEAIGLNCGNNTSPLVINLPLTQCQLTGVFAAIYRAAFGSWSAWQNTLLRSAPLMLTALCTALPARIGLIIIGNEGALIIGGIAALIVGLALEQAAPLVAQIGMAAAGIGAGGVWIALVGLWRHYRGVNETISSLLLNYIAIALLNYLVEGPMRDPASLNRPASLPIAAHIALADIANSRIHLGLVYGLVACAIAYVLIQHTTFGFAVRSVGGNERTARLIGLPVGRLTIIICFLAGSCAGLAGMVEVAAVHGRISQALNANYGYSGILVAFVARHNPLAAIVVSTLLGGIIASGGILQRAHDLPNATVLVFQGIMFLCVLASETFYDRLLGTMQPDSLDQLAEHESGATPQG
ncbi:nucleoside ABC transporter membrane protein [Thalassoporum mexicanum PCC 7367]|uniref:ABC transporter permease n=1 Tax=Thalassoporum mexicanum TaxID=3457544 RepID=UPI00029FCEAA|nr:ABC transporter permease [Pseudanabaena sp. PCC 7367]AFY69896.1 nucleoside ABC transporter membrane protein [Pseudanabaena sp. PCC 7367]